MSDDPSKCLRLGMGSSCAYVRTGHGTIADGCYWRCSDTCKAEQARRLWRKEPPTEPGLYWAAGRPFLDKAVGHVVHVDFNFPLVEGYDEEGRRLVAHSADLHADSYDLDEFEWWGSRIEPPRAP